MKKLIIVAIAAMSVCSSAFLFAKHVESKGYVRLYNDEDLKGFSVTVPFKKDIPDLQAVGINDRTSSVEYDIPAGWVAILYKNSGYSKDPHVLQGKGALRDLGLFNDEASSIEWKRQ